MSQFNAALALGYAHRNPQPYSIETTVRRAVVWNELCHLGESDRESLSNFTTLVLKDISFSRRIMVVDNNSLKSLLRDFLDQVDEKSMWPDLVRVLKQSSKSQSLGEVPVALSRDVPFENIQAVCFNFFTTPAVFDSLPGSSKNKLPDLYCDRKRETALELAAASPAAKGMLLAAGIIDVQNLQDIISNYQSLAAARTVIAPPSPRAQAAVVSATTPPVSFNESLNPFLPANRVLFVTAVSQSFPGSNNLEQAVSNCWPDNYWADRYGGFKYPAHVSAAVAGYNFSELLKYFETREGHLLVPLVEALCKNNPVLMGRLPESWKPENLKKYVPPYQPRAMDERDCLIAAIYKTFSKVSDIQRALTYYGNGLQYDTIRLGGEAYAYDVPAMIYFFETHSNKARLFPLFLNALRTENPAFQSLIPSSYLTQPAAVAERRMMAVDEKVKAEAINVLKCFFGDTGRLPLLRHYLNLEPGDVSQSSNPAQAAQILWTTAETEGRLDELLWAAKSEDGEIRTYFDRYDSLKILCAEASDPRKPLKVILREAMLEIFTDAADHFNVNSFRQFIRYFLSIPEPENYMRSTWWAAELGSFIDAQARDFKLGFLMNQLKSGFDQTYSKHLPEYDESLVAQLTSLELRLSSSNIDSNVSKHLFNDLVGQYESRRKRNIQRFFYRPPSVLGADVRTSPEKYANAVACLLGRYFETGIIEEFARHIR